MKMTLITQDGRKYVSAESDEYTTEKAKDEIYKHIDNLAKMEFELSTGGYVVIPGGVIQTSVFVFED